MCAVSATHKGSGDIPYFWSAPHRAQIEFLEAAQSPYVCLGCASSETRSSFRCLYSKTFWSS
jgi:hypothetical protein